MYLGAGAGPAFPANETQGREFRTANSLIATSSQLGWHSLYAAMFKQSQAHGSARPVPHPYLVYMLDRPVTVMRKITGNPREKGLVGPRHMFLTPGEVTLQWEDSGPHEILQVYLRQPIYAAAVQEMGGRKISDAELIPRFAFRDPLLEQFALAIIAALKDGSCEDKLYIDAIGQMMALHLVRHHSSCYGSVRPLKTTAIASWKIRRLIEFIDENLHSDLSLETISAEVGISPFYLPRAFKTAVGQSPHQYVLERRIERAKELLRNSDLPIMDIALSAGFSSQGHLSSRFMRRVGVSPAVYRRQGMQ
jgi:AraC family transcriptional regulator